MKEGTWGDCLRLAFSAGIGATTTSLLWQGSLRLWRSEEWLHLDWLLSLAFIFVAVLYFIEPLVRRLGNFAENSDRVRSTAKIEASFFAVGIVLVTVAAHTILHDMIKADLHELGMSILSAGIAFGIAVPFVCTLAWSRGVRRSPSRAGRYGAISAFLLVGIPWLLYLIYVFDKLARKDSSGTGSHWLQVFMMLLLPFSWLDGLILATPLVLPALAGGIFIDRIRPLRPSRSALVIVTMINVFVVTCLIRWMPNQSLLAEILAILAGGLGWWLGLELVPNADILLTPRRPYLSPHR